MLPSDDTQASMENVMAHLVRLSQYNSYSRDPALVNLDQVAFISQFENGSIIHLAVADERGELQFTVWETVDEIMALAKRESGP
jgi:hypothetical protein